jgi:hypothetical protein
MEVVTIEKRAFDKLCNDINAISTLIESQTIMNNTPLSDIWMDNQDVCQLLKISKRTLQHYRDTGKLPFSQIGAKVYYKAADVEYFLESHMVNKSN